MDTKRLARVRGRMRAHGLSQILISQPTSIGYLLGEAIEPGERLYALLVPESGECSLFINALFPVERELGVRLVVHRDEQDPILQLAQAVGGGALGVDKFWPSGFLIRLMAQCPSLRALPGWEPVEYARMRKDERELAALRAASRRNDEAMRAAIGAIRAGMTERELATAAAGFARELGIESFAMIACFGKNGAFPHHETGDAALEPGDSVIMDMWGKVEGYACDMTRTVFFGGVSERQREVYETVRLANQAAAARVRPGVTLREVDAAAREVIARAGFGPYFTHRTGHGVGIDIHEMPDVSASSEVVAEPGMAFSIEPGVYLPGEFGVRVEDLAAVTPTGVEVLNAYPRDLCVVG